MQRRVFHGWRVVVCAFLVAFFGWALGFYGPGIYLAALRDIHGWSIASISSAITVYYLAGAVLIFFVGDLMERIGSRPVVIVGTLVMAAGVGSLGLVTETWQVYASFLVMSAGWASMSGAAVNTIVAPWFDRRRGLAVSLALNGASFGGVVGGPLLIALIDGIGFAAAVAVVGLAAIAVLTPLVLMTLRPPTDDELKLEFRDAADGGQAPAQSWSAAAIAMSPRFHSISLPFALGLFAQVGFLTHQVAFLSPRIGIEAAGWAVSLTTTAAIVGRLGTGFFIDRIDPRWAASANFLVQTAGMAFFLLVGGPWALWAGCVLVGLGVGNLISLPPIIVQKEFPRAHFARIIAMVIAINQLTLAFGPGGLGLLRDWWGSYDAALMVCIALELIAAAIVLRSPRAAPTGRENRPMRSGMH